jgi:hypothetical protein
VTRATAARTLAQLLGVDAVGHLLDEIDDRDLRDLMGKVAIKCRAIAVDADDRTALEPKGGQIAATLCVASPARQRA